MKRLLLSWVLTVGLALGTVLAAAQETPPGGDGHAPKIVCDEPEYNFGEVDNSHDVEHTYIIRNEGDLTLEITRARASCGCTVASIAEKSVPPGGQTEISARLSLKGRKGPQRKTVTVESNDPKQPNLTLVLAGTAIAEMEVRPNQLFFGRIPASSVVTGTVDITVQSTNTVHLTKASTDVDHLSAAELATGDPRLLRVQIETVPPLPNGSLRGTVHLETDHPRYPSMDIIVAAFVTPNLTYAPQELVVVESDQPVTRVVILRGETGTAFEITKVVTPSPAIQSQISAEGDSSYKIEVSGIVGSADLNGMVLRIMTTLAGSEQIEIPFRLIPRPTPPPM